MAAQRRIVRKRRFVRKRSPAVHGKVNYAPVIVAMNLATVDAIVTNLQNVVMIATKIYVMDLQTVDAIAVASYLQTVVEDATKIDVMNIQTVDAIAIVTIIQTGYATIIVAIYLQSVEAAWIAMDLQSLDAMDLQTLDAIAIAMALQTVEAELIFAIVMDLHLYQHQETVVKPTIMRVLKLKIMQLRRQRKTLHLRIGQGIIMNSKIIRVTVLTPKKKLTMAHHLLKLTPK